MVSGYFTGDGDAGIDIRGLYDDLADLFGALRTRATPTVPGTHEGEIVTNWRLQRCGQVGH